MNFVTEKVNPRSNVPDINISNLKLELHGTDCISQLVVAFPLRRVDSLLKMVLTPTVAHNLGDNLATLTNPCHMKVLH